MWLSYAETLKSDVSSRGKCLLTVCCCVHVGAMITVFMHFCKRTVIDGLPHFLFINLPPTADKAHPRCKKREPCNS